jgi:GT2 family glycosyltransferase
MNVPIVVIGKNEGERLKASLTSAKNASLQVVYVDSQSTDNSLEIADLLQIPALSLDNEPFVTAALARNKGAYWLLEKDPSLRYIQFLDGDTTLEEGWLAEGMGFLESHPSFAIVAGHLSEKNGEDTLFKKISQLEWEMKQGEISASGGNMLIRVSDFEDVGGFNPKIIAAEDTELCLRTRMRGRKIYHIDKAMGVHDSQISSFGDLCRRLMRTGYAFHQVAMLHKRSSEKLFLREDLSNWFFGGIFPLGVIMMALWKPMFVVLFLFYPLWMGRIYLLARKKWDRKSAMIYAALCVFSKFPGFLGALIRQFHVWEKR